MSQRAPEKSVDAAACLWTRLDLESCHLHQCSPCSRALGGRASSSCSSSGRGPCVDEGPHAPRPDAPSTCRCLFPPAGYGSFLAVPGVLSRLPSADPHRPAPLEFRRPATGIGASGVGGQSCTAQSLQSMAAPCAAAHATTAFGRRSFGCCCDGKDQTLSAKAGLRRYHQGLWLWRPI